MSNIYFTHCLGLLINGAALAIQGASTKDERIFALSGVIIIFWF